MKTLKEHLKEVHGHIHQDCNFGHTHFNLKKKDVKLSAEDAARQNKPTKGHGSGGGTTPPPPTTTGGGCIFLDFTGYTVTGTSWNYNGDIVCAPANLTPTQVDEILASVVEDYKDFRVVVTTDETLYDSYPFGKKTRVIFTETWEWYGQAGGTSFVGSFLWTTAPNNPCFVFTSLLNYNTKYIKEAASHEAGHTIGLYHQSSYDANHIKTSEYNRGGCPLTCGEAPIMGVAYYEPIGRWWIGPTPYGWDQIQDDYSIIASMLGLK
jgi:hypothetical protein